MDTSVRFNRSREPSAMPNTEHVERFSGSRKPHVDAAVRPEEKRRVLEAATSILINTGQPPKQKHPKTP